MKMVADAYKVKDAQTVDISTPGTYTIENDGEQIYPVFTCSGTATVSINGTSMELLAGESVSTVPLENGSNSVVSTTSSTLTMEYQERRL